MEAIRRMNSILPKLSFLSRKNFRIGRIILGEGGDVNGQRKIGGET